MRPRFRLLPALLAAVGTYALLFQLNVPRPGHHGPGFGPYGHRAGYNAGMGCPADTAGL